MWGRDYAEAIRHFQHAAALDPDFFRPQFAMAVAYSDLGEREKAAAIVGGLYERRDRFGPQDRVYIDWLGASLEGRHLEGLARLRELERMATSDPVARFLIGAYSIRANRPGEAIEALTPLLSLWARNRAAATRVWPVIRAAAAYHMLGRFSEELALVREMRVAFPQERSLRTAEARALAALGQLQDLDRLIAETLALPGAGQAAGDVMEEAVAELRVHGHREEAIALAGRAVAWHRGLPPQTAAETSRHALGRALYQAERWEEARTVFATLAAEHPDNPAYQRFLGTLAARLGDRAGALRISQALERVTGKYLWGEPSYFRGVISAVLGNRDEAVALLQRAFAEGRPCDVPVRQDMDLESLRDYPPFQELVRPKG